MTNLFSRRARRGSRLLAGLLVALAACDGGGGQRIVVNDPVTRVDIAGGGNGSLTVGGTMQLTATGYTFTGEAATGRAVAWSSSDESVATVSGTGMVTAMSAGAATIRARIQDATGTLNLTVSVVPVASVTVSPETATLSAGTTVQLAATTRDAAGATLTGRTVTWTALDGTVAGVNGSGLVTAIAAGVGRVVATSEGRADTATITVRAAVASVEITPPSPTVVVGATAQLTATARDAGGAALTGRAVAWAALDPAVATVSAQGVVTAMGAGQGRITATVEGRTAQVTVTVVAVPVATVLITPPAPRVNVGFTTQLTAVAQDAAGNPLTGRAVAWASLDPAIATVSAQGVVTGVAPGNARITATVEGKTANTTVVVSAAPVAAVEIQPASPTVFVGASASLTAVARDALGNVLTGRAVAWASLDPSIVTVTSAGVIRGVAAGQGRVTATVEGRTAQVTVTVNPAAVATVTVTPSTAAIVVGGAVQLSALARDAGGNALTGRVVTWSSLDAGVATVSGSGVVTGVSIGQARIVGTVEGKADTATVTVSAVPVASVVISPSNASVRVTETVQLTAMALDAAFQPLTGRAVSWSTLDPARATVSGTGLVTGVAAGQARIVATVEGKADTVPITVTPLTAARVEVSPRFAVTNTGTAVTLTVSAFTAGGVQISNPQVSYTSLMAVQPTGNGSTALVASNTAGRYTVVVQTAGSSAADTATIAVLGPTSILSTAFAGGQFLRPVQPGETITVPVRVDMSKVSANGDLGSAQLDLDYDPALLAFTGHAAGISGGILDVNSPTPGKVRVAYANTSPVGSADFTLVNLTFQVSPSASTGTRRAFTLTYTAAPTSTSFAAYATPVVVGGKVQVGGALAAPRRARRGR